jgi:hypothetical protein
LSLIFSKLLRKQVRKEEERGERENEPDETSIFGIHGELNGEGVNDLGVVGHFGEFGEVGGGEGKTGGFRGESWEWRVGQTKSGTADRRQGETNGGKGGT